MILITGIPRSGTSYMHYIFEVYGKHMNPSVYSAPHHQYKKKFDFKTFEPVWTKPHPEKDPWDQKKLMLKEGVLRAEFKVKEHEIAIKALMHQYYGKKLAFYSRVIFCYRDNFDAWYKSAEMHETVRLLIQERGEWLKDRAATINVPPLFVQDAFQYWKLGRNKIFQTHKELIEMNVKSHLVEFDSDHHRKSVFEALGLPENKVKEAMEQFRGSKYSTKRQKSSPKK